MAYSVVPLVATGDLWTAANQNTYVRDNMSAIWVGTTAGDTDYYTGAANKSRLAVGTAGQIKRVNAAANAPMWGGILYAHIYAAVDTTVGTAADTLVEMDTAYLDVDDFVSASVDDRITIPAGFSGYYLVNYYVEIESNAAGYRTVKLRRNAGLVDIDNTTVRMEAVNGAPTDISAMAIIHADAGDYITLCCYQNSGGDLDVTYACLSMTLELGDQMAYSAVSLVATGDLWTAANNNTYLKDNMAATWVGTTAGDTDYYTAATTKARLAIGTAGELQRMNAGETVAEWGGLLYALISDATPRAIVTATFTEVTLTVEDVDVDGFVAAPVANKITIPANFAGRYLITYRLEYASDATGYRIVYVSLDGGGAMAWSIVRTAAINGDTTIAYGAALSYLAVGKVITLITWQNSGGNLNVINAELGLVRL